MIRHASPADLPELLSLYQHARQFMAETGNPTQWKSNYPSKELLLSDIARNEFYILEENGRPEAAFMFTLQPDPSYTSIQGSWLSDAPYGTIHRIASFGRLSGAGSSCIQWCFSQCRNLRADTHEDNKVMQHVLEKNGFKRCGIIQLSHNGEDRIAYQKL